MAKVIGGLIRLVFWTGLSAAVGYNYWQVQQLRSEVSALRREAATRTAGARRTPQPDLVDSVTLLSASRAHADRAQKLLKEGRLDLARKEMSAAAAALRRATEGASPDLSVVETLRRQLSALSGKAGALWEKPETNGRKDNDLR